MIKNNYPIIRPALDLNFAGSKTVDPRITFTRASTATYFDGKTVAKAEENLLRYSQDFDNTAWRKVGATVSANTVVAPDGTTTADTVTLLNGGTADYIEQLCNITNTSHVFSCFLKAGTATAVQIGFVQQLVGVFKVEVDLATGAFGTPTAGLTALSITDAGGGWWRVAVLRTFTASASNHLVQIFGGASTTAGQTFHIWGAQLEQR